MYKQIKKIPESHANYFLANGFICQQRDELGKKKYSKRYYTFYSYEFEKKWEIKDNDYNIVGNMLYENGIFIYHLSGKTTIACNIKEPHKILYQFDLYFSFSNEVKDGVVYAKDLQDNVFSIELDSGKIIQHHPSDFLGFNIHTSKYYIGVENFSSLVYVTDINFNLLWQRDISVEGEHKDWFDKNKIVQGRILSTILYKEKYVIISMESYDSICLELATGKEVWRGCGSIYSYAIAENIAYCTSGASLWKLNLDTGIESKYFREYSAFPDFEYEGYNITWPDMHDIQYFDGLLWFLCYNMSTGFSFVIAVHPETGNYEWIHKVDSKHKVMSMKFHQNRIYLNSTNDLFVYEKE